uniref:Dlg5 protein n=2 Tax=Mus musculus TaxID=10090 RepID=Q8VCB6_MOUSE|nr:Dlg5 protein [Mus musculus]
MDQEFSRRLSMSEVKDDNTAKTLSAAARRSFFRRKHKHKRSGSKDGKDLLALDTFSNDSIPLFEDSVSLAYQRVQKVDCTSLRPVLLLGPLLDVVKEMLVNEAPGKFCRCPLEVMKASQQAIERGVKDCLFVDYKRRSGHFDVTTVASIKEITEKGTERPCLPEGQGDTEAFQRAIRNSTEDRSGVQQVLHRGCPGWSPVQHLHSDPGHGQSRTK